MWYNGSVTASEARIDPDTARRFELPAGGTAWPTVALFLGALVVQAGSTWAALAGWLPAPLAVLVNAAAAYSQFTVVHDAAHRSASRWGPLNEALGYGAAFVLFGPFEAFRRNHLHHHAHTNDPAEDPDFWVAGATLWGTAWRCFTLHEMHYWNYFTRLARRDGVYARTWSTLVVMAAVLAWGASAGRGWSLLLYWMLPAQLAGTALAFLFDYWPHRPHRARGRLKDTAVIAPRWLDPPFLSQNIHLLHHLFPTVPWYLYRRAFTALEPGIRAEGGLVWDLRTALSKLRPSLTNA